MRMSYPYHKQHDQKGPKFFQGSQHKKSLVLSMDWRQRRVPTELYQ